MRYSKKRVDKNQKEIVDFFRKQNCQVLHLHTLGSGIPDILVNIDGFNVLIEIKSHPKAKLTKPQETFHQVWNVEIVHNKQEALNIIAKYENNY